MPSSQSSTEQPKPRLRGDMYLRAEERRRAEIATELTEILTPPMPVVYEPPPVEAATAVLPMAVAAPVALADGSVSSTAAPRVPDPVPALSESAAEPDDWLAETDSISAASVAPGVQAPVASNLQTRPATLDTTVPRAAVSSRRKPAHRRSLTPAATFAAIALAGALGVALTLRTSNQVTSRPPDAAKPPAAAVAATAQSPAAAPTSSPATSSSAAAGTITPPQPLRGTSAVSTPAALTPKTPPVVQARRDLRTPSSGGASEGQIRITSTPAGARVTVNGIGWGQTPVTIGHLPFGSKVVRLTRDGYTSQQTVVNISGDQPFRTMSVTLRQRAR